MSVLITLALFMASAAGTPQRSIQTALDSTTVVSAQNDSDLVEVNPGRDQSGSWIAFHHLGGWTPEIQQQMQRDNPGVSLSQPPEGKPIKLRRSLDRRGLPHSEQIQLALRKAVAVRVVGQVDITLPSGETHRLQANEFIAAGARIRTRRGASTELVIDNQSILRLRENSRLAIESIQDSGAKSSKPTTQVALEEGGLWTKVRKWAGSLVHFQVRLPNAIAGVHGTIFECTVTADHQSQVKVLEGIVGVSGAPGSEESMVTRGQLASVSADGVVTPPEPLLIRSPMIPEENESLQLREDDIQLAAVAHRFPGSYGMIGHPPIGGN